MIHDVGQCPMHRTWVGVLNRRMDRLNLPVRDADLIKAYYREISKSSWIDNLSVKVVRWALFQAAGVGVGAVLGAGALGIVGGAALGFFDSFLLDKLSKGWKPDQFIEGSLKTFVRGKT